MVKTVSTLLDLMFALLYLIRVTCARLASINVIPLQNAFLILIENEVTIASV